MQKFGLFVKSKKFHWNSNKIYYFGCFGIITLYFLLDQIFSLKGTIVDRGLQVLLIVVLFGGIINKFFGLCKIDEAPGEIDGFIIFDFDNILVKDEKINIQEIGRIKISNEDYSGKLIHFSSGNVGPALSDGTNNWLTIYFNSGERKSLQFQLIHHDDFQKIRQVLITYYIKGKIDFEDLKNILGEESKSDVTRLKIDIGTATNSAS